MAEKLNKFIFILLLGIILYNLSLTKGDNFDTTFIKNHNIKVDEGPKSFEFDTNKLIVTSPTFWRLCHSELNFE